MSFFYSEARRPSKPRHSNKLPMRGKKAKRERRLLLLLRDFEVGTVYTFYPEFLHIDLPADYHLGGSPYEHTTIN